MHRQRGSESERVVNNSGRDSDFGERDMQPLFTVAGAVAALRLKATILVMSCSASFLAALIPVKPPPTTTKSASVSSVSVGNRRPYFLIAP